MVKGKPYHGIPLEEIVLTDGKIKTVFKLFLAKKSKTDKTKQVNLYICEAGNDYRVVYKNFSRSYIRSELSDDTMAALGSGVFEGEIITYNAKLQPDRHSFVQDDNFLGLLIHIEEWFAKHGQQHLNRAKRESQNERYKVLGLESLRCIDEWIREMDYKSVIQNLFTKGSIGVNHVEKPGKELEHPRTSIHGGGGGGGTNEPREKSPKKKAPVSAPGSREEHPNHMPMIVQGPGGKKRQAVLHGSIGLTIIYDELGGSSDLWKLNSINGELTLNITHPLFQKCEKLDSHIKTLQEKVIRSALLLEIWPDKSCASQLRRYSDKDIEGEVALLVNSNSGSNRVARLKARRSKKST